MQLNEQDQNLIGDVASQQLGAPKAPQQPPQEAPATKQEQASAQLSPSTEGDKQSSAAAEIMRIKFGDGERELSSDQIKGTFDRYSALNFKHQNLKPMVDLAEKMLSAAQKKNPNASAKDLAKFMTAAAKAQTHNAKMGKGTQTPEAAKANQQAPKAPSTDEVDNMLKQWEDDNAVSLPPRFRETMDGMTELRSQNDELRQMLQQVIKGQQGVTQATQKQLDATDQREGKVMRERIGNNLAKAQQQLGLADEDEQAFMQFAYSRGYTIEDFIDPQLTATVAQDFKASKDAPELERLRAITQKRQAFTGNGSGTPNVSNQAPASNPDQTFIDAIANKTYSNRGM
jgi:hypothetical protein